MTPKYAVLTKVLDSRHALILEDWLEFLAERPAELVVYIRDDARIWRCLDDVQRRWHIECQVITPVLGDDLRRHETAVLKRMVERTVCEWLLLLTLDALPYRKRNDRWLEEVFGRLNGEGFSFFSACGVTFRGDRGEQSGRYLFTQRFSNNCGLIPRVLWSRLIDRYPESLLPSHLSSIHSEWAIERGLENEALYGLRRVESLDWRVFHVQQWDDRLFKTRELFRRGVGIQPYLNRVWEDLPYPEAEFYNYPLWPRIKGCFRALDWPRFFYRPRH